MEEALIPRRREERHKVQSRVRLIRWGHSGQAVMEDTFTENVSRCGACVLSELPLERGNYVQVIRLDEVGSFIASVRGRSRGTQGKGMLHLDGSESNGQSKFDLI